MTTLAFYTRNQLTHVSREVISRWYFRHCVQTCISESNSRVFISVISFPCVARCNYFRIGMINNQVIYRKIDFCTSIKSLRFIYFYIFNIISVDMCIIKYVLNIVTVIKFFRLAKCYKTESNIEIVDRVKLV